jgi:hypothetical protein
VWSPVTNQAEVDQLQQQFNGFHDSVISEMKFGADNFVDPTQLSLTLCRHTFLRVLFQRQSRTVSCIEVVFRDLYGFTVTPNIGDDIYGASMSWRDGWVFWVESGIRRNEENGSGWPCQNETVIQARTAFWREVPWLGRRERYTAVVPEDLEYYDPQEFDELDWGRETKGSPR